jgi:phosphoribosylaminoimidazole-succinocarboxamide synthase
MKRDEVHAKEVATRRIEKARIKQLKELQKNINNILDEMFQSISDLEIE